MLLPLRSMNLYLHKFQDIKFQAARLIKTPCFPRNFPISGLAHPPDKSPSPQLTPDNRRRGTDLAGYMLSWRVQLMKQPRKKTWKKPRRFAKDVEKLQGFGDVFHDGPTRKHMMIVWNCGIGWCERFVERWFQIFEVDQIVDQIWPNNSGCCRNSRCMMEVICKPAWSFGVVFLQIQIYRFE